MTKGYGTGWLMGPHGVKSKHDLAAALHPAAVLGHAVLADVKSIENRRAIRSQVEGEDPLCGIGRRRVTLISASRISLLPPDKGGSSYPGQALRRGSEARAWNEPAERQQTTGKPGT